MRFELKDYDITYDKETCDAIVYKDDHEVMQIGFDPDAGIYDIVSGAAICMVHSKLLETEDIEDVIDACGMSMEAVRELLQKMTASMQRVYFDS